MTDKALAKQRQRLQINIKFGDSEEERAIYDWLKSRPYGVTPYIRRLVRYDMDWQKAKHDFEEGR